MEEVKKSNKWSVLIIVVLSTFMSTLDSSIVNVALPSMARSLHVTTSSIQFVATSYLIVISGTVLIFGKLGDMFGKTKMFISGIIIFTIGSFLCGLSGSFWFLIVARAIQAIGAAGTMANNQGIIVGAVDWKYIFLINVPIGIVVVISAFKLLPRTALKTKEKMDLSYPFFHSLYFLKWKKERVRWFN